MTPKPEIAALLEIMAALRTPGTGCPWDLQQNFETIAPYTIEEAYEVADAIERRNLADLKEELGDLLLQVVFHARMAEEAGAFAFGDVVEAITTKLVRRHPHVFGDRRGLPVEAVNALWEQIKAAEKAERRADGSSSARSQTGALAGVSAGLPALARAVKLQAAASRVGFDWNDPNAVLNKIREETGEIEAALADRDATKIADEIGDLLFAVVNLARHVDADPEAVLRKTNIKFERRFASIERALKQRGTSPEEATLDEMEELWQAAKLAEKA